jgi:transposase
VVLDHLAAHKVDGSRRVIAGAAIRYLPPYSPDLAPGSQHRLRWSVRSGAPIEQPFATLKALLRQAAARTRDELWQAIGRCLANGPSGQCANYLNHCGYGSA